MILDLIDILSFVFLRHEMAQSLGLPFAIVSSARISIICSHDSFVVSTMFNSESEIDGSPEANFRFVEQDKSTHRR